MPYGTIKVDNITFDNGGTDKLLTVSGLFFSTSGALTVTGAISGGNVTAPTATFTTLTGTTTAGTTATFTSGSFTSLTGVTTTVTSGIFGAGSATAPSVAVGTGTTNRPGIYSPGADQVAISTSGTGRITVDASGRLLVGTSAARSNFFGTTLSAVTQTEGTGGAIGRGSLSVINNDVSNNPPYVLLGRSGAATLGSNATVISGSRLGTLTFHGADGTSFIEAATVAGEVDGTPGASDMPGRLVFSTTADGAPSPTERLRIDSSGRVGIGTASPGQALDVKGIIQTIGTNGWITDGDTAWVYFGDNANRVGGTRGGTIGFYSDYAPLELGAGGGVGSSSGTQLITFKTGTSERARIDSSGRLLVGTQTSVTGVDQPQYAKLQVVGNTLSGARSGLIALGRSAAASTIVAGDQLGGITFGDNAAGEFAYIFGEADGTAGTNDYPGRLVFSVTPDGGSLPTTSPSAMTINSGQEVLIGYSTDNGAYKLQVNSQIFATSATIATSDGRYKENVVTLDDCVDLVKALRPVSFDWKHQEPITRINEEGKTVVVREAHNFPDGAQVGFIAQEVQEVLAEKPWLTSVIKQNIRPAINDSDGNELAPEEEFFGIAEGNLVAVLTSALKDAIGRVESLEASKTDLLTRLSALEAA